MNNSRIFDISQFDDNQKMCGICLEDKLTSYNCSICNYNICTECSHQYFTQYKNKNCPHCREIVQIEVIVGNQKNSLGFIDNRKKFWMMVKKYKKTLTILMILQFNVPAYYLGNSTGICSVEDSISNYIINILLGYSILGSVLACITHFCFGYF